MSYFCYQPSKMILGLSYKLSYNNFNHELHKNERMTIYLERSSSPYPNVKIILSMLIYFLKIIMILKTKD